MFYTQCSFFHYKPPTVSPHCTSCLNLDAKCGTCHRCVNCKAHLCGRLVHRPSLVVAQSVCDMCVVWGTYIVTLRLIVDVCLRKRQMLFVAFVDFSKAYDRVPRDLLLNTLRRLGCGMFMLGAIASLYHVSYSIVGTVVISVVIGVRQGSPTSCFLFRVYVNGLIR